MKRYINSLMGLGLAIGSATVLADSAYSSHYMNKSYLGISYLNFESSQDSTFRDNLPAIRGELGTYLQPNLSFALHYARALDDDDSRYAEQIEFDDYLAVYLRPEVSFGEGITGYGLVGYAEVDLPKQQNGTRSSSEYGPSYGFGGEWQLEENTSVKIEYLRLLDEDLTDVSSIGLGLKFKW